MYISWIVGLNIYAWLVQYSLAPMIADMSQDLLSWLNLIVSYLATWLSTAHRTQLMSLGSRLLDDRLVLSKYSLIALQPYFSASAVALY